MTQKRINLSYKYITIMLLGFATVLAACGGEAQIDPNEIGSPERGREIFENGNEVISAECAGCHSLDGVDIESGLRKFPTLQGISERAGDRLPEMSSVDYLRESILDPSAYIVDGYEDRMEKGYKYGLSEEEVNDLIAFFYLLSKPSTD